MLLGVIAVGSELRVSYYLAKFSLFLDECAIVLKVRSQSCTALSQIVNDNATARNQIAPAGFVYLLKVIMDILGSSEQVVRLVPLLCGLGTIAAFYLLSRKMLSGWAQVAANLLVCVNQTAILYSAQAKQYSMELMVAVLMLIIGRSILNPSCQSRLFWAGTLMLGILPWFSFSSVFVLGGIALVLASGELGKLRCALSGGRMGAVLVWVVLLIPVYFVSMRSGLENATLGGMWSSHYFPLHALSGAPHWLGMKIEEVCTMSFNKRLWPLAAIGISCGLVASARRGERTLLAGAAGVLVCLLAAVLQKYPFSGRLIVFSMPALVLVMVTGYQWLRSVFPRSVRVASDLVATSALLWCFASAVNAYGGRLSFIDEPREALRFVKSNWKAGDHLYATRYATPCVVYYGRVLGVPSSDITLNVYAPDGVGKSPTVLSVPVSPGRRWLVEMRTDWAERGESVPVREYFEFRAMQLARKDVEWTTATLYLVH